MSNRINYFIKTCPVCSNIRLYYLFSKDENRVVHCNDCGLLMLNPQPSDEDLSGLYCEGSFKKERDQDGDQNRTNRRQEIVGNYLELLSLYREMNGVELLEIGCESGYLAGDFKVGLNVTSIKYSPLSEEGQQSNPGVLDSFFWGNVDEIVAKEKKYDVCYLPDVLGRVRDPKRFLKKIHGLLKPNGTIFISTPNTDSLAGKYLKDKWMEFGPQNLYYFNTKNLERLLLQCGFGEMITRPDGKTANVNCILPGFWRLPIRIISRTARWLIKILPLFLKKKALAEIPDRMIVMGNAQVKRNKPKVSIVVPAFNEAATIEEALNRLLLKRIDGLDTEIVIVESNSTDGTREIVLKYNNNPSVKILLEDEPKGKGHAVRTAMKDITGDFVLIQDADLEYDLEDYDSLLEPLVSGREAFVLGSRHGGRTWKIRKMEGNPFSTFVFNCAHWVFVALINVFYGVSLKDPFTMFKVFRRDCLYGLNFECNRFDFDYELVIKLMRKGYRPIEIPVNYNARSFEEGKKISIVKDPWTWLWAIVKYRFVRIDPLRAVNDARNGETTATNSCSGN